MKKHLPLILLVSLIMAWFSCSKEKKTIRDFCGEKIILKDTLFNGDLKFHFRATIGSENTLTLSRQYDFYDTGMIMRCDTLVK